MRYIKNSDIPKAEDATISIWSTIGLGSSVLLLVMNILTGRSPLVALAFLINIIIILLSKNGQIIYGAFLLLPFTTIYKTSPASTSLFTIIEVVIVVLYIVRKKELPLQILIGVGLFVSFLVTVDITNGKLVVVEYARQFTSLIILYCMIDVYNHTEQKGCFIRNCIVFFSIGLIAASVLAQYREQLPFLQQYVKSVGLDANVTVRFAGLNGDPNYYSLNVILALLGLCFLYFKKQVNTIIYICLFGVLTWFGIKTYSKSFLLMYSIVMIILMKLLSKEEKKTKLIVIAIAFSCVALFMLRGSIGNIIMHTFDRMETAVDMNELTTGRSNLWLAYIDFLANNPKALLFGVGIGSPILAVGGVHNWYIESVYFFGIIGTVLYASGFIISMKTGIRLKEIKTIENYFGFGVLFMLSFFLGCVLSNEVPFHMCIAHLIYTIPMGNSIKENKVKGSKYLRE